MADTVFRFVNQVVEMTVAKANDFVQQVGDFASKLKDLEAELRRFGDNFPRVLKALVEQPRTFVTNLTDHDPGSLRATIAAEATHSRRKRSAGGNTSRNVEAAVAAAAAHALRDDRGWILRRSPGQAMEG